MEPALSGGNVQQRRGGGRRAGRPGPQVASLPAPLRTASVAPGHQAEATADALWPVRRVPPRTELRPGPQVREVRRRGARWTLPVPRPLHQLPRPPSSRDTVCPARPRREYGVIVRPTKSQLNAIRTAGGRQWALAQAASRATISANPPAPTDMAPVHLSPSGPEPATTPYSALDDQ